MAEEKDTEQDRRIQENAARITRNEEAIARQTAALEMIRDHYYPQKKWWKKLMNFFGKVICIIMAYLGIAEAVDWIWNTRESQNMAREYAAIAKQLYFEEGDAVGAAACYEKAIELDDGETDYKTSLMIMKGMSLSVDLMGVERPLTDDELSRVNDAQTEAIVLKKQEPENPMPNVMLAQVLLLRGEREAAVAEVDAAVRLKPDFAPLRISSCAMHFFAGKPQEARAQLDEAERLDSTLPLVLFWKGLFALKVDRDPAAAKACFEEAIRRFPRHPLAYVYLGRVILEEKAPDLKAARTAFARALALEATQRLALMGMAESYEREGNRIVARIWLDRLIASDANYLPALLARARINGMDGDFAAAVDDLSSAIALAPLRDDLYRLRAEAYEKAGDAVRAATDRKTAAALLRK